MCLCSICNVIRSTKKILEWWWWCYKIKSIGGRWPMASFTYHWFLLSQIYIITRTYSSPFAGGGFGAATVAVGARAVAAGLAVVTAVAAAAAAVFCLVVLDCNVLDAAATGFFFATTLVSSDGAGSTRCRFDACCWTVSILQHVTVTCSVGFNKHNTATHLQLNQSEKDTEKWQQQQPFYGPMSGTTQVSWYHKKHSTTILIINQPLSASNIYYDL